MPIMSPLEEVDSTPRIIPQGETGLGTAYASNEEAFASLLQMYARPGMVIADVTYGKGVFWKNVDRSQYEVLTSDLEPDRAAITCDFRSLPYEDRSIDLLVLDPPYWYTPAASKPQEHHDERYKLSANHVDIHRVQDVVKLYKAGMVEALRVLRTGGFLFVKCQDTIQDGRQFRTRIELHNTALALGYADKDECVVYGTPMRSRWPKQIHLHRSHSYFLVFRKGGAYPFGYKAVQNR